MKATSGKKKLKKPEARYTLKIEFIVTFSQSEILG